MSAKNAASAQSKGHQQQPPTGAALLQVADKMQKKSRQTGLSQSIAGNTNFMQTQTFHRRNLSNLINMSENEEVADHVLISRGGPPRRTLEQIEQGSSAELPGGSGEDVDYHGDSPYEMMDSQESAAENDFQDKNSNFRPQPDLQVPKGGFFDMVEHPSIRDEHDDGGESGDDDYSEDVDGDAGDYPQTARDDDKDEKAYIITPSGQGHDAIAFKGKMDLHELQKVDSPSKTTLAQNSSSLYQDQEVSRASPFGGVQPSHSTTPATAPRLHQLSADRHQMSQATNESCSSLETNGQSLSTQKARHVSSSGQGNPYEVYGGSGVQAHRRSSGNPTVLSKPMNPPAQLQVYQYYPNADDIDSLNEDYDSLNEASRVMRSGATPQQPDRRRNASDSSYSQVIETASPSPQQQVRKQPPPIKGKPKFKLQIEIDSDEDDGGQNLNAPPSAPKQGNFIQFEEVKGATQHEEGDVAVLRHHPYEMYGHGIGGVGQVPVQNQPDTPGLSREQQISSQKMLTPNEQRLHQSYFPKEAAVQRALPSTKSYQTPHNYYGGLQSSGGPMANPFMPEDVHLAGRVPFRQSIHIDHHSKYDDANSVSTTNPQYYHMRQNGQIGHGQHSTSRVSDRIYAKAQVSGHSPDLCSREDYMNYSHQEVQIEDQSEEQLPPPVHDYQRRAISQPEQMDAQLRRLEELNRIEAQRLREPLTTDESPTIANINSDSRRLRMQEEETRDNCPDEYNLLSHTASADIPESVEILQQTASQESQHVQQQQTHQIIEVLPRRHSGQEAVDTDLNDRESMNGSEQVNAPVSLARMAHSTGSFGGTVNDDHYSRRLYVITEESQSMAGQTIDPSRLNAASLRGKHVQSGANLNGSAGKRFLQGSLRSSSDTPFTEPELQTRRLTQGSSHTMGPEKGRSSNIMLDNGSVNTPLDLKDHPKSLNQTMASPKVNNFNDYCDRTENISVNDHNPVSMAQVQASVSAEQAQAILALQHQRSKSQQNNLIGNGQAQIDNNQQSPMILAGKIQNSLTTSKPQSGNSQKNHLTNSSVGDNQQFQSQSMLIMESNQTLDPLRTDGQNSGLQQMIHAHQQQFNVSAGPISRDGKQDAALAAALKQSQLLYMSTQNQRDVELMSQYLKQASNVSTTERRYTHDAKGVGGSMCLPNDSRPFDVASDEDLLASNFDRISKILPNHDQLPDLFNGSGSGTHSRRENESAIEHRSMVQSLLNEIQELKQIILQKDQVISIKDNTIAEFHNDLGLRSSQGITSVKHEVTTRSVASLALPDTFDKACQTFGPRKISYYRSIPAKVKTNLPNRSPSTSQERIHDCSLHQGNSLSFVAPSKKKLGQEYRTSKINNTNVSLSPGRVSRHNMHASSSYSPNRRRHSPSKDVSLEEKVNEDVKSLRLQLMSLKKQLNAQEQDNMTLIVRVTALKETIDTQERNYDVQFLELEERREDNQKHIYREEELIQQIDSLMAECAELRQAQSGTFKTEMLAQMLQERRDQYAQDFGTQTDDQLWYDWALQILARSKDTSLQELTNDQLTAGVVSARSIIQAATPGYSGGAQTAFGAGLFASRDTSHVLDQLSEVLSGEQGAGMADYDRIMMLVERANTYEQQQTQIEQEISQYKRLMEDMQQQQTQVPQPFTLVPHNDPNTMIQQDAAMNIQAHGNLSQYPQQPRHKRNPSYVSQVSASPMNLQHQQIQTTNDYLASGTTSFELDKSASHRKLNDNHILATQQPQIATTNTQIMPFELLQTYGGTSSQQIASLHSQYQQQLGFLQAKLDQHKRKGKKFMRKCERLQLDKHSSEKTAVEVSLKMNELNERYRDLRAKYQLKLQEKNLKISDLKSQLNRMLMYNQTSTTIPTPPLGFQQQHSIDMQRVSVANPIPFQVHHGLSRPSVGPMYSASHGELGSQYLPPTSPLNSDEQRATIVTSEDNKGQKASLKKAQVKNVIYNTGGSQTPVEGINSISAVHQNPGDKSSLQASHQGDIYQIVSTMVDKRMAEKGQDGSNTLQVALRSASHGSAEDGFRGRKQQLHGTFSKNLPKFVQKQRHGTQRPDLAILRDNRGIFFQQSPSELLGSRGAFTSQSPTEENFSLAPPRPFTQLQKSVDLNERMSSPSTMERPQLQNLAMTQQPQQQQYQPQQQQPVQQTQQPQQLHQSELSKQTREIDSCSKRETLAESYANRNVQIKDQHQHQMTTSQQKRPRQHRSKSSDKRDLSFKSALSKDDVMPCYKYKVEGRKRNDIEYQPPISLMSYLHPVQIYDENCSQTGNNRRKCSSSPVQRMRKY